MTDEKVYHQDKDVTITSTRAEIKGKTHVMSNVTSVSMGAIAPSIGCAVTFLIAGLIVGVVGLSQSRVEGTILMIGIGAIIVVLGIIWLRGLKTSYSVNLCSSSGETRVITSFNQQYIARIVGAIKQAIIDSGIQKVEAVSNTNTLSN